METQLEKKWYQKPTTVVLLLIFFFPVGLYLMWKYEIWSKTARWVVTVILALGIIASSGNDDSFNSKKSTIDSTKSCLIGYDWLYPSSSNPTGAWKFNSNGKCSYSTTLFGGMTKWGNWSIINPGEVNVSYTRTTEGTIPSDQTLIMSSCNSLKVGSTVYMKN
tara:strand:- start:3064 stop:3552 length:489 start_codon:yes stop_codon:yes gene_type:complete